MVESNMRNIGIADRNTGESQVCDPLSAVSKQTVTFLEIAMTGKRIILIRIDGMPGIKRTGRRIGLRGKIPEIRRFSIKNIQRKYFLRNDIRSDIGPRFRDFQVKKCKDEKQYGNKCLPLRNDPCISFDRTHLSPKILYGSLLVQI